MKSIDILSGSYIKKYKLISIIGRGSRSTVWQAEQSDLEIPVAVRMFLPPASPMGISSEWQSKFSRGAERFMQLRHPNILPLYDYGIYENFAYTVMPYMQKRSLEQILHTAKPLSLSDILSIMHQLAQALSFAHEREIWHHHIKTTNIMWISKDHVSLSDFALVAESSERADADIRDFARLIDLLIQEVSGQISGSSTDASSLSNALQPIMLKALSERPTQFYPRLQDLADEFSSVVMEALLQNSLQFQQKIAQEETNPFELFDENKPYLSRDSGSYAAPIQQTANMTGENKPTPSPIQKFSPSQILSASQSAMSGQGNIKTVFIPPDRQKSRSATFASNPTVARRVQRPSSILPDTFFILMFIVIMLSTMIYATYRIQAGHAAQSAGLPASGGIPGQANTQALLFADPLSQNNHLWPLVAGTSFHNNAYYIANQTNKPMAAILKSHMFATNIAYSLTTKEITGEGSPAENVFGLVLGYRESRDGKYHTLYSFEVVDGKNKEYRFWKYDDTLGGSQPWILLWHAPFGNEFRHASHGTESNVLTLIVNDNSLAFVVNSIQVGEMQKFSIAKGAVGMSVAQRGEEVAFSCLVVKKTHLGENISETVAQNTDCQNVASLVEGENS